MSLVESIEGCPDCAAEETWLVSQGHVCDSPDPRWTTLCEVTRDMRLADEKFHRLSHEPQRCNDCKAILDDRRGFSSYELTQCASDLCDEWRCPYCQEVQSSSGPVDCPTCGSLADTDG